MMNRRPPSPTIHAHKRAPTHHNDIIFETAPTCSFPYTKQPTHKPHDTHTHTFPVALATSPENRNASRIKPRHDSDLVTVPVPPHPPTLRRRGLQRQKRRRRRETKRPHRFRGRLLARGHIEHVSETSRGRRRGQVATVPRKGQEANGSRVARGQLACGLSGGEIHQANSRAGRGGFTRIEPAIEDG